MKQRDYKVFDIQKAVEEKTAEFMREIYAEFANLEARQKVGPEMLRYVSQVMAKDGWSMKIDAKPVITPKKVSMTFAIQWLYRDNPKTQADFDKVFQGLVEKANKHDSAAEK